MKKTYTQHRNYIITLNNPDVTLQEWFDTAQRLLSPLWIAAQLEQGENGTPHIQASFGFKEARKFNAIKKLLPRAHIEPAKLAWESYKYCQKDESRVEGPLVAGVAPAPRNVKGATKERNELIVKIGAKEAID